MSLKKIISRKNGMQKLGIGIRFTRQGLIFAPFYFIIFLLVSCTKSPEIRELRSNNRAVLVYMTGNMKLEIDVLANINQMEAGIGNTGNKLIVYAKASGDVPKIYEIVPDSSAAIQSKVLKTYPDHNSADPKIMRMVFQDMQKLAESPHYAAILWSHATNWFPPGSDYLLGVNSFPVDAGRTMDVQELRKALPAKLDFLIFDGCSMGSVEVLYELKEHVPYVLASSAEVISSGMPYDKIIPCLFEQHVENALTKVANLCYDHYYEQDSLKLSASFSLIDIRELSNLAQVIRTVFSRHPFFSIARESIQDLNLNYRIVEVPPAFDLLEFFKLNFSEEETKMIEHQLEKTVRFKIVSARFLNQRIRTYCGLSTYIPVPSEMIYYEYYQLLGWHDEVDYAYLIYGRS